ncbi:MAG: hypothetical protein ACD_72C00100G0001 [uncultured bacterium]|nr:MAG: hypothetical protein ACD_72C00100G0001 [uncultured bacterium]
MQKKLGLAILLLTVPFLSGCSIFSPSQLPSNELDKEVNKPVAVDEVKSDTSTEVSGVDDKAINNKLINNKNIMEKFDPSKQYVAVMHTTAGDITISFNKGQTPKTVENFVTLAQKGFYDKTIFHRVITGFMIQGGDPLGNGTGGPGYKFEDEPFTGEYMRGAVAMANSGPNTNGSQFFIMHADYPLPPSYTIFGKVISGMEAVDKIANSPVKPNGEGSSPVEPTIVKSIDVSVK